MKKVRIIQLDLLSRFAKVCEENNLKYFMNGGTLLGAVRHKGFIPWDDDVDVIMPRKDYDKLCDIANRVFCYPYFFQTAITEEFFFRAHAQLRNSSTTGYIPQDKNKNINKGIFLDIFILDAISDSYILRTLQKIENSFFRKVLSYASDREYNKLSPTKKFLYKVIHFSYRIIPFKKQFEYYNHKIMAKYSNKQTKRIGDLTLGWRPHVHWKSKWYDDYIMLPFEELLLRAPICYHEVLQQQYGNYMEIPSLKNIGNGTIHDRVVFEPDIPYTEVKIK